MIKARIHTFSPEGEGLFTQENREFSTPFVIPGEEINIKFHQGKKQLWVDLEGIVTPSPHRIDPKCVHFGHCGGCMLQHIDMELYRSFKKSLVMEALSQNSLDPLICEEPLILPFGKRRRANLEGIKKEDKTFLGFHRLKSHQIINLSECHALTENLRCLIVPLRQVLNEILEPQQKAKIFMLESDSGIDLGLEIAHVQDLSSEAQDQLEEFAKIHNIGRLFFRYRKKRIIIHQQSEMIAMNWADAWVPVDAYSFVQATKDSDYALTNLVMEALPSSPRRIVDLFSGRGTFSFSLAQKCAVDAYESDLGATQILQQSAQKYNRPIYAFQRDLFQNPLTKEESSKYDVTVLNPPRAGAAQQIFNLKSPYIVYVSCSPQSFAKDGKILTQEKGYRLVKVTPVDQFGWSAHVEVVGVFSHQ